MIVNIPISSTTLNPIRISVCAIAFACVSVGCTSKPANPIPQIPPIQAKSAEQLCKDAGYDPNIVVYRDESSRYRLAAIGVTGSGNLDEFAAVVGPSVVTTRGGATVMKGGDVDTEVRACDTYKKPTP